MSLPRILSAILVGAFVGFPPLVFGVDCNGNGSPDAGEIRAGRSEDCNGNGVPDECEQTDLSLGQSGEFTDLDGSSAFFAAADMDGDGDRDFVTGIPRFLGQSQIGIHFNQIDDQGPSIVSFSEPVFFPAVRSSLAMELGDVDGDGSVDVALITRSLLAILFNDGAGALSEPETFPLAARASDLSLADVSGDGISDVVVSHDEERSPAQVSIFLSDGKGSLHPPHLLPGVARTVVVDSADLDGDGDIDIVTANRSPLGVSVLLNDGCTDSKSCAFSSGIRIALTQEPIAVKTVALAGDASADLVVASAEAVVILRNNGNGTSFKKRAFSVRTTNLNVSDLDSDGDVDIISSSSSSESLVILVNAGDGTFDSKIDVDAGFPVKGLQPGDFDGDNAVDLAVVSTRLDLGILVNGFKESIVFDEGRVGLDGNAHVVVLADFDGDGDLDVVTGNGHHEPTLSVVVNNLPQELSARRGQFSGAPIHSMAYGDFDNDGDFDLVVGSFDSPVLRIFDNRGDAVFTLGQRVAFQPAPGQFFGSAHPLFLVAADLDGDEWPELISTTEIRRGVSIFHNNGGGVLENPVLYGVGAGTRNAEPVDLDDDGDLDLAVANSTSRTVSILINRGNGEFEDAVHLDAAGTPFWVNVGDWNRDGFIDLATASFDEEGVVLFLQRPDRSFETVGFVRTGAKPVTMATGDLNQDGFLDLVTTNESSNNISVILNDAGQGFFLSGHYKVGSGPRFAPTGDLDGNGADDVVVTNRSSGVTVFFSQPVSEDVRFSEHLCTFVDFAALAVTTRGASRSEDHLSVKYTVPARGDPSLISTVFQNTKLFPLHQEFLPVFAPEHFPGLTAQGLIALTQVRATRDYYIGAVERIRTQSDDLLYIYSIVTGAGREEVLTLEEVRWVHERMSEALTLRPLAYAPDPAGENPLAREAAESWVEGNNEPGFQIFLGTAVIDVEFAPYTKGVGYGRVRLFRDKAFNEANESGRLTFQDIVVIDHAPRDMEGVVGGVITAKPQGSLSHVSIRTARRGTPNAFVDKALALFGPYEGKLVRLEVTQAGYHVEESTQEEAEKFWAQRPSLPAPPFDAEYRGLDRFEEMDFSAKGDAGSGLVARFGGKASGLARLQTILDGPYEQYGESGFAIPMAYYLDFMRENTIASTVDAREVSYQSYLEELFEMAQFQTDSEFRFETLDGFRDFARQNGVVPDGLIEAIAQRVEDVFGSREVVVRHRSSSNVEDLLEFNAAGLHESTSVCVADTFDGDDTGPSVCDPMKNNERSIERALKKVWTSLWTFRAHEERAYFQIPQESAAMGILVNRAFLDEKANGVAFTGDPVSPRGGCYIITAQVGEESVVSPEPGVLPELNILEVTDGNVVNIVRSQPSTLVNEGDVVLSDENLRELGALMWHIDESYPVDTEGRPREDILLDMEFKIERDGSLAVKQIRPFLIPGGRPGRPTFELVIPAGAEACGVTNVAAPSGDPRREYESKGLLRFRAGTFELPASRCVFSAELFEEVLVGPAQEVAIPEGAGVFRVSERPDVSGTRTLYEFTYQQRFSLEGGRTFEIKLFNLDFATRDGETPVEKTLVLDEEYITFELTMLGFGQDPPLTVTYSSCSYDRLPAWSVAFELEGGSSVLLDERFLPPESLNATGPAALQAAEVSIGGHNRRITSYWDLVYSSGRHNIGVTYWVFLSPPVSIPGVDGDVHVVALDATDPPEAVDIVAVPQEAAVVYLDENFEVLARSEVLSFTKEERTDARFLRGDCDGNGVVGGSPTDAIVLLNFAFKGGGAPGCLSACDAEANGSLGITDALRILRFSFLGIGEPDAPFPDCTTSTLPTDETLGCEQPADCK